MTTAFSNPTRALSKPQLDDLIAVARNQSLPDSERTAARNQTIEAVLPSLKRQARKLRRGSDDFTADDLVNETVVSILRYFDAYDPSKRPFTTWCSFRMHRQAVELARFGGGVRVPHRVWRNAARDGIEPRKCLQFAPAGELGFHEFDVPAREAEENPNAEKLELIAKHLHVLDDRELLVVGKLHLADAPATTKQLAGELGCSQRFVRMIRRRAISKLQRAILADGQD